VDPGAVEQVKQSMEAPPEQESILASVASNAGDAVTLIGRSIWGTVKSIF
jgi:hypothetical protein